MPYVFFQKIEMKKPLLIVFIAAITHQIQAQSSIGLRLGLLLNNIHDCSNDKDYSQQPASMGGYVFYFREFKSDWGIQAELGYSQRNTHTTNSGVSHYFTS